MGAAIKQLILREALYAIEFGYDAANTRSMSPRTQELIAKLGEVV